MLVYDPAGQGICETMGADAATSLGTSVTPNAVANTKGSWVSLGTTTFAYEQISPVVCGLSSTAVNYVADFGIFDGTTYTPILSNWTLTASNGQPTTNLTPLPIHVPAGSQIGARVQANGAGSLATQLALVGLSAGYGGQPGYSRGFNLTTAGTGISATSSASANTRATVQLVASTAERAEAVMMLVRLGTAGRGYLYDLCLGSAGNEAPLIKDLLQSTANVNFYVASPLVRRAIPASSRLSVKLQASTGSSQINANVYGFA